jgi:DNA-directed RNA polymerase subunit RPC12/RpoP
MKKNMYVIYKNPTSKINFENYLTHHVWNNGLIERVLLDNIPLKIYCVNNKANLRYKITKKGKTLRKEQFLNVKAESLGNFIEKIFKKNKILVSDDNLGKFIFGIGIEIENNKTLVGEVEFDSEKENGYIMKVRKLNFGKIGRFYYEAIYGIEDAIENFKNDKNIIVCSDCKQEFTRKNLINGLKDDGLEIDSLLKVPMNLNCPNCKSQELKVCKF